MTELEFLLEIKEYVEEMELRCDKEWGKMRKLDQLINDKIMPNLYDEIITRIANQNLKQADL